MYKWESEHASLGCQAELKQLKQPKLKENRIFVEKFLQRHLFTQHKNCVHSSGPARGCPGNPRNITYFMLADGPPAVVELI